MQFSIGDKIGGRYEVYRVFGGKGLSGMGVVYVCYDHKTGGALALKTYQEGFFNDSSLRDHFKRGALAWIKLERHPCVVRAYGVFSLSGQLFLGLEYIAPDDENRNNLGDYLRGRIDQETALKWGVQFCDGMQHAHDKGIFPHRDIKPANLLITRDGNLKVADFDLAGQWQPGAAPAEVRSEISNTAPGMTYIHEGDQGVAGTLPWMAPEQFEGKNSEQSDIYSFGVVLYQLCNNGHLPLLPNEGQSWEQAHNQNMIEPLQSPLWRVIRQCLAKDPVGRFGGSQPANGFRDLRAALIDSLQRLYPDAPLPEPAEARQLEVGELNDRGVSLTYLGLPRAALKVYKKALALQPQHAATYLNIGVALNEVGELEQADKAFRKAMRLDPAMPEAYLNHAMLCKKKGQLQQAEGQIRQAIELAPDLHRAYETLGILVSESGRHSEAIQLLKDALQRDPLYAGYHYSLGVALEKAEQFQDALRSYQQAVRLQPDNAEYHYGLGNGYRFLGDMQHAIGCWQRTAELDPAHGMVRFNLGIAFERSGDNETAYSYYHQATLAEPENANSYYNLGLLLANAQLFGEGAEAFEHFVRYAASDPQLAPHIDKAREYVVNMRKDEEMMQQQMDLHQAVYNRGLAYLNLGRLEDARPWFERALKMNPDYPNAICGMGIYHERRKEYQQAVACYQQSIKIAPEYTIAWNNLGWVHYLMGNHAEASAAYQQFIQVGETMFPDWVNNARQMLVKIENELN